MPLFCEPRDRGEVFLSYMDLIVGSWAVNLTNMTVNGSLSSKIHAYTFVFSYLLQLRDRDNFRSLHHEGLECGVVASGGHSLTCMFSFHKTRCFIL